MGGVVEVTFGRRDLLASLAVGWFADQVLPDHPHITGALVGASHRVGHRLRLPLPSPDGEPPERAEVVVVGSGVSGLTAAWRLREAGLSARVLELEPFLGGTSTWGEEGAVMHPWGAHYLPVPEPEARPVARLLEALGVITGWDAGGRPIFRDELLCHAPEERLFFRGAWHGGLLPWDRLDTGERAEVSRFIAQVGELQNALGNDGRRGFTIPLSQASRDPRFTDLDRTSMAAWLDGEGYRSRFLRWFVEYGTRDDFGADLSECSAWAGLHYFAARTLETEQLSGSRYLVWPEGNGWLVRQLLARLTEPPRSGALVLSVQAEGDGVMVRYLDLASDRVRRIAARGAILAVPGFVATRLVSGSAAQRLLRRESSPWLVANLHVARPPGETWDSVLYDSPGLGYVDAGHQGSPLETRTVLTYFRAYGAAEPAATRAMLLERSWADHASAALADLGQADPRLVDDTRRIDVMLWGHAMPRPTPGFLAVRDQADQPMIDARVAWGHVDQTGYAIFEEATDRGVRAAEALAEALGVRSGESWV
ncbi:MAG: FAD/NAD(P)-binding protein [Polyangiaceae bacterium]